MNEKELEIWWTKHRVCPRCKVPVSTYETTTGISPYHDAFKCNNCRYMGLAYELLPKPSEADTWYKKHTNCPKCHSHRVECSTIGVIHISGKPFFDDSNTATCLDCGWDGMLYQLVESDD